MLFFFYFINVLFSKFEGSSLRSKVIVEYGSPFVIEDDLIELY